MPLQTLTRKSSQAASEPLANRGTAGIQALSIDNASGADIYKTKAPFMRRFAAVSIYDYIGCLWLATLAVVSCRLLLGPDGSRLTDHAPIQALTLSVFLFRDCFFKGRGLGKGLLGLAVVDERTKRPATLFQSLLRNLVFLAPYFIYQITAFILSFCQPSFGQNFGQTLLTSLQIFGISYAILVVLVESVLMLQGKGRRLADRLSGTMVVKLKTQEPC